MPLCLYAPEEKLVPWPPADKVGWEIVSLGEKIMCLDRHPLIPKVGHMERWPLFCHSHTPFPYMSELKDPWDQHWSAWRMSSTSTYLPIEWVDLQRAMGEHFIADLSFTQRRKFDTNTCYFFCLFYSVSISQKFTIRVYFFKKFDRTE